VELRITTVKGKRVVVLEEDGFGGFVSIEVEKLTKLCEDVFPGVKADTGHKLRGKTLRQAILEDTADELGWAKYKAKLQELGLL